MSISNPADAIRTTAFSFCTAFVSGAPPSETLDQYFTPHPKIHEHGPSWAISRLPFLATTFRGRRSSDGPSGKKTCDDYYDLLTSILSFHPSNDTLPPKEQFMVDPVAKTVTVKMHAGFKSVKTGKGWEEEFVYVLSGFDEQGRIGCQELWADPLSAWVAVGD